MADVLAEFVQSAYEYRVMCDRLLVSDRYYDEATEERARKALKDLCRVLRETLNG